MAAMDLICVQNFINGRFVATKEYLDSYEPATGLVWAKIPDSGSDQVDLAVQAANDAFPSWSTLSYNERSQYLLKVAELLEKRQEDFARMESRDQGKPLSLARKMDLPRAVLNLRHFAQTFPHILNRSNQQTEFSCLNYTCRSPIGVAALIVPWNLPLYLLTFKLSPALMAGNTIVCKPSEMTSVTAWMLCSLFMEAGVPDGVVNMVFGRGSEAGQALIAHPHVPIISFTGSTVVGRKISITTAPHFKKLSLEMGGKNAAVIFTDAELDKCIAATVRSSFLNQGEICLCTSRLYVQRPIFETFLKKFIEETKKLRVGPSLEEDSDIGALISKEHKEKVEDYIKVAIEEGATIHCRDKLKQRKEYEKGYFMSPTVITGLPDSSRLLQEEIFGPVVCISPFDTEKEVIERVNNVKYGLCATIWSKDVNCIHRTAHQLQVGTVWANCWLVRCLDLPFGGVKQSGVGREGTEESMDFFTEIKTVCVKLNEC